MFFSQCVTHYVQETASNDTGLFSNLQGTQRAFFTAADVRYCSILNTDELIVNDLGFCEPEAGMVHIILDD